MQYLLFPAFLALSLAAVALAVALWRTRALARRAQAHSEHERATREAALRAEAIAYERERIYNDLHDDLGARLLGLIHAAPTPQQADQARAILQDLRDVVTRSRGTPGTLGDVLADIRNEAVQRLAAVDIGLVWQEIDVLPDPPLDTERALHLHRIVREAISNTIRHAQARRLRVRLRFSGGQLGLELTDDGEGVEATAARTGSGMRSMRDRAAELAGEIRWTPGTEGGTKVLLSMPLQSDGGQ
jgi:signal transduction histidine kinase